MKINLNNELKITAAIKEVEGKRISCRTLTYKQIKNKLVDVDRRLNTMLGGKANWVGVVVEISENFGPKNSAHKCSLNSTFARATRFKTGWFITSISRDCSNQTQKGDWQLLLNPDLKERATNHMLERMVYANA